MGSSANSAEGHIGVIYGVQYEEVQVSFSDQVIDGATNLGSDLYTWSAGLFGDDPNRKSSAIAEAGNNMTRSLMRSMAVNTSWSRSTTGTLHPEMRGG